MRVSLNRLVQFENPPTARNTVDGTPEGDWTPLAYEPGSPAVASKWRVEWKPTMPSRSESVRQGLEVARDQIRIRMRWRNDISAKQRVLDVATGDYWQVAGGPAEIGGRRAYLELVLERFSTGGANG